MSQHQFQTEVSQLLHLIIHSLYSHKEIFLRELVSNSSDALDKLKHLTLTDDAYKQVEFDPRIDISFDEKAKKLTISDTGIGMNENDLVENLGTIANSGTKKFVEQLTGDAKRDSNLIGQFGVGFYSCYMVADKVEVVTRKAGENDAYLWSSDGKTGFDIEKAERDTHGTSITLHLNEEGVEYVSRWEIQNIVKKYSNHIPFPIFLHYEDTRTEGEGDDAKTITEQKEEQINAASAFWKRSKSDLTDNDYKEFYKDLSHDYEDPMFWSHVHAEGTLDYTTLFYIPSKAPFDLYRADYTPGVKLYVKRVFITDDEKELMPTYLRFVKGIIDSEDLPLNVSREILQQNRVLAKIKTNSVKKILSEFTQYAKDSEKYEHFYKEFGRPLKEGLYQDYENRDTLLELVRFKSTKVEGLTSLADYASRMQGDQNTIYYITGENEASLRLSPLLEMYKKKDIEVLILDDEIDEIVIPSVNKYKDFELKSVNRSDAADELKTDDDKKAEENLKPLIERIKKVLGDKVKDVKASSRLSDSPSCIVADTSDPTFQMQAMLKAMGQDAPSSKPILEINPGHSIIEKMQKMEDGDLFNDSVLLVFEQALVVEGLKLENPADFVKRMNDVINRAL
ncbi:MAG: molecular chaperone HtpG [Spirochaetes bacterium]|nr:molecular chaperone HtpG [Spirochaetota bacterium]MBN2772585.1 molecular chaperone HtpG [Spirochaetota bacterium]